LLSSFSDFGQTYFIPWNFFFGKSFTRSILARQKVGKTGGAASPAPRSGREGPGGKNGGFVTRGGNFIVIKLKIRTKIYKDAEIWNLDGQDYIF
jgi:hypothetical protein